MTKHDSAVERAARLDTAALSDALDKLGIAGQCQRIKPLADTFRLTGRAHTLSYGPASTPPGSVGDYIDDVRPGSIVVIDNRGREDVTVWGDILTEVAQRRGIGGTVIDGACRDVALCLKVAYPVFSRGNFMRTGKGRVELRASQIAVSIGEVRVNPGDLLSGDRDGVVVIPSEHENAVLDVAEHIERVEERIREAVRDGMRLDQARKRFRYHDLQKAESEAS